MNPLKPVQEPLDAFARLQSLGYLNQFQGHLSANVDAVVTEKNEQEPPSEDDETKEAPDLNEKGLPRVLRFTAT